MMPRACKISIYLRHNENGRIDSPAAAPLRICVSSSKTYASRSTTSGSSSHIFAKTNTLLCWASCL
jgi:hypothetical protein